MWRIVCASGRKSRLRWTGKIVSSKHAPCIDIIFSWICIEIPFERMEEAGSILSLCARAWIRVFAYVVQYHRNARVMMAGRISIPCPCLFPFSSPECPTPRLTSKSDYHTIKMNICCNRPNQTVYQITSVAIILWGWAQDDQNASA